MKKDIASLIRAQPTKVFRKNEILFHQGETPRELYALRSGFVKVSDISAEGYEQMIWLAKKYDIIPVEWLFGSTEASPFYYTAHTDVKVFAVDRELFLENIRDDPKALLEITTALGHKQRQLLQHISATLKPKAHEKIVFMLYYIAQRFNQEEQGAILGITIQLTHQNIANLVGITRETASLELHALRAKGYIDYGSRGLKIYTKKLTLLLKTL